MLLRLNRSFGESNRVVCSTADGRMRPPMPQTGSQQTLPAHRSLRKTDR